MPIVEVTQVAVASGGVFSPKKRMINTEHIVTTTPGGQDTTVIELTSGERLNVLETYEELKGLFGL